MYSRLSVLSSLAFSALLAAPACAQVVGHYSGTTTDGNSIQFDVTQDSGATTLSVTGASIGFSAKCRNSTQTLDTGWGFGLSAPIVNKQATLNINTNYYNFVGTIVFNGKNMHGNVASLSPTLNLATNPPTSALFCSEAKKLFTGSLMASDSAPAKPAIIGDYIYDSKGRVLGVIEKR